jgi:hypothetical protein
MIEHFFCSRCEQILVGESDGVEIPICGGGCGGHLERITEERARDLVEEIYGKHRR